MPTIEKEDRTVAEAWGKVEPDTTQKTDAFAAGHATAREKYQKLLAKERKVREVLERLFETIAAKLAEERAHADRLAKALDWTPIPEGTPMDYRWQKERHEALAAHRQRREARHAED